MNVEEARELSKKNQKNNKDFNNSIKWTEMNIEEAIEKGERKCVMSWEKASILESIIKYWEDKGFEVKTNIPPSIYTFYLFW